jgi:hypothetical protein
MKVPTVSGEGDTTMESCYRIVVRRIWSEGVTPDPETYWGTLDEAVTIVDSVLGQDARFPKHLKVATVEVTPFSDLSTAELLELARSVRVAQLGDELGQA